jgi:hypothetical protein
VLNPLAFIVPFSVAATAVTPEAADVVTVGLLHRVAKETSSP